MIAHDKRTLRQVGVRVDSRVSLTACLEMTVHVSLPSGDKLTLQVPPNISILGIKNKLESLGAGTAARQYLRFNRKLLTSGNVASCEIQWGSTLQLTLGAGSIVIVIRTSSKRFKININGSDKISKLKLKVFQKEGTPPSQ